MEDKDLKARKGELRSLMLRMRGAMSAETREALSLAAQQNLAVQPVWKQAGSVALYIPAKNELSTEFLWNAANSDGKRVYLPRVRDIKNKLMDFAVCRGPHELSPGAYGLREPNPQYCPSCDFMQPEDCLAGQSDLAAPPPDLFIIPGLAYDLKGRRLGFGGGYYDRFLANPVLRAHSSFIGLAYSFQVLDCVPAESWDQPVDAICTELGYRKIGE